MEREKAQIAGGQHLGKKKAFKMVHFHLRHHVCKICNE